LVARFLLLASASIPLGAQDASFSGSLYQVLEKASCRDCHNPDGVASATRLHFPEPDEAPARIHAFGNSLVNLIDKDRPEESLLLRKPTNRTPHTGGVRIKPGGEEEAVLKAWIRKLATLSGEDLTRALKYREEQASGAGRHGTPQSLLRRLTHSQYNNTVRDLLGDQTKPALQFPPEDFVQGFKNQYQAQNLSPLLIEAYSDAAERLARNAFRGGDTRGLIPCAPSAACRARFVREFGLKAFRRSLEPDEQKRYEGLLANEKDFLQGAKIVVEAMLQSPYFLFRLEETANPKWKPYAAASRLSYAIWDSMPDSELLEAARRGDLVSEQGVEKTARRMLDHTKARQALDEFVSQWLRFDRIMTASKDRRRYAQFTRETAVATTEEARLFIGDLVWNDRNYMDIYRARYSFLNADLATIYSVPAPAREFDRVELPLSSERAGILGQTLFLALNAKPDESSPTARGLFVREHFLCQKVAEPPPGVNTNLPPVTEAKPQTNRERMSEHATNPSCATCHNLIDAIGFGFEKFDAIGARREKLQLLFGGRRRGDGGNRPEMKTIELDIDSTGYIAGLKGSNFTSPLELGRVMAESSQCQECIVKQYFRYISGRVEAPADRRVIAKVLADFRNSQFRFKELIVSLIKSRESPNAGAGVHVATHHQTQ